MEKKNTPVLLHWRQPTILHVAVMNMCYPPDA